MGVLGLLLVAGHRLPVHPRPPPIATVFPQTPPSDPVCRPTAPPAGAPPAHPLAPPPPFLQQPQPDCQSGQQQGPSAGRRR